MLNSALHKYAVLVTVTYKLLHNLLWVCSASTQFAMSNPIPERVRVGSFHVKSPNALNGSDPDFDENAYIWSL